MGLSKIKLQLLGLVLLITSCSKTTLTGLYTKEKLVIADGHNISIEKRLELNKDSSFSYTETHEQILGAGDDVGPAVYRFFGKGYYTSNQKQLTFKFDSKFKKINKIEVLPVAANEISKVRKKHGHPDSTENDKIGVVFHVNNYQFKNSSDIGYLYVNGHPLAFAPDSYEEFGKKQFPLELNFDFGHLTDRSVTEFFDYQYPEERNTLGFNLGFQDEKIVIEKPGNYQINLYLLENYFQAKEQVITGKRVFSVKTKFGKIKIDDMEKKQDNNK
jgi:hypothetical protein